MTDRSEHDPWAPVNDVEAPVVEAPVDPEQDKESAPATPSNEGGKSADPAPSTQDENPPAKSDPDDVIAEQLAELDAARKGK